MEKMRKLWWHNGAVAQSYADFTERRYGAGTTVVFDGYEQWPTIKGNAPLRRQNNIYVSRYQIHDPLSDSQQTGDADTEIVKAAVETSHLHTTTLIGEDTDLLVLLPR